MTDAVDETSSDDTGSDDAGADGFPTATSVLDYVVRQLVEDPDAVSIELDDRGRRPVLNVHVGPGDMGRVIGKRGRVAQSIRTVVRAAAARDGGDVEVEFVD
ncbi:MAG TPA: KH domain-containing protein [Acidimicrobiales bacterium]